MMNQTPYIVNVTAYTVEDDTAQKPFLPIYSKEITLENPNTVAAFVESLPTIKNTIVCVKACGAYEYAIENAELTPQDLIPLTYMLEVLPYSIKDVHDESEYKEALKHLRGNAQALEMSYICKSLVFIEELALHVGEENAQAFKATNPTASIAYVGHQNKAYPVLCEQFDVMHALLINNYVKNFKLVL